MNLQHLFSELLQGYTQDMAKITTYWTELRDAYARPSRHYHNLTHLENLYHELVSVKTQVHDWEVILWSLFYHDAVYDTLKSNNEEKSAALAEKRMKSVGVSEEIVARVVEMILATKTHVVSENQDINYFTDADLSILGKDWEVYNQYAKQVRSEYTIYPDLLYNPGRKKVLKHFLAMNQIFKTDYFTQKYEEQARVNISRELAGDRV